MEFLALAVFVLAGEDWDLQDLALQGPDYFVGMPLPRKSGPDQGIDYHPIITMITYCSRPKVRIIVFLIKAKAVLVPSEGEKKIYFFRSLFIPYRNSKIIITDLIYLILYLAQFARRKIIRETLLNF